MVVLEAVVAAQWQKQQHPLDLDVDVNVFVTLRHSHRSQLSLIGPGSGRAVLRCWLVGKENKVVTSNELLPLFRYGLSEILLI